MEDNLYDRKDKIVKDHNNHTHTMTVVYPNNVVQNMKKEWRIGLEQYGEWLEKYDERLEEALNNGYEALEKETEAAKEELENELTMTDEELFKDFKKKRVKYLQEKKDMIDTLPKRKEELKKEIMTQMEPIKKNAVMKAKEFKDALKMWDNVKTNN